MKIDTFRNLIDQIAAAVVDVWDALQSDRPYRKARTEKQAIAFLKEQSGIQFDPQIPETFFELINET